MTSTPLQHQAAVKAFYSTWDGQRTYVRPQTVIRLLQQHHLPADGEILDIGFGNGEITLAVAQAFPRARITALDLTQHNVQMAQNKARQRNIHNIHFLVADAETWQPPAATYHAIYAMQLMQFIAQPDALLQRLFAGLKPGAALHFATPFLPPQAQLHPFFVEAYTRVIPNSFQYRTENAWFRALFNGGYEKLRVAKTHWEPSTQSATWQAHYHAARQNHGIDYETARRNTWGGIISARKPKA